MDNEPNLELLRLFEVLYRERHLTRAAMSAGCSQPAMSRSLARLRELFGDPLFVRGRAGMLPTPRADQLIDDVRALLERARSLVQPVKFDARTLRRTFVIATSDLVEQSLAAGIVKLLSASAPLVDLAFRAVGPDIDELLTSGRADLLFAPKASLPPGTVSQALYDDNFACVVRKGHPRIKTSLSLAAYAAELHIQIAPRGLPGGPVDDALAARGLVRRVAVRTPSFLAAPLFASNSDLLLTAPSRLLASLIEPFGLRVWDVPLPLAPIRLVQGWHPRAHDDAGHKFFRGLVATAARALRDG